MTKNDGIAVVSRHGAKTMPAWVKDFKATGNIYDKIFVTITEEVGQKFMEQGKEILGDKTYENSILTHTDLIRTLQSGIAFTSAADVQNTYHDERPDLATPNADWGHPEVKKIMGESMVDEKLDWNLFIKNIFNNFYFPSKEDASMPSMADAEYSLINSIKENLVYLSVNQKEDELSFMGNFNHAPTIDTLAMRATESLEISPEHRVAEVNDNYQGGVAPGEMFVGNIYNLQSDNPSIELEVKGKVVGYTMKDLENIEKTLQTYIE